MNLTTISLRISKMIVSLSKKLQTSKKNLNSFSLKMITALYANKAVCHQAKK